MVNVRIVVSVSILASGLVTGIVMWMRSRGRSSENMTLLEACDGYFGSHGKMPESESTADSLNSCDTIRAEGWNWDTMIECSSGSDSFYTMRGVFDAVDRDYKNITGSSFEEGHRVQTFELLNYITDSCSGSTRNLIDLSEPDRELWSVSDLNYGPCSVALAVSFLRSIEPSWGIDTAECSGNPLSKGNCYGTIGNSAENRRQIFRKWSRTSNNWIQQACYNHDICLQRGGNGNHATPYGTMSCGSPVVYSDAPYAGTSYGGMYGRDCDFYLGQAASRCLTDFSWGGWSRGFVSDCSDTTLSGIAVWAAIGLGRPNAAHCGV